LITEEDLATTKIRLRYDFSPTKNIIDDLSGLIGRFCEELIGSFYARNISRKANIVITELLNNAVENSSDENGNIAIELEIDETALAIRVKNMAKPEQYEKVKSHVDKINSATDTRKLLADTIRARRNNHLKGGLGLIRLVAENKFRVSVVYERPFITIESLFPLGGLS
jgi:hypothetical protein